ncbi:biopolymer transporter ExbD [Sphingomonas sp. LaA6.9]|uniref:ExbD/TolR family protein n=1 Tax=Sphingomonas sp. LaA6.9 TaxID=2919914 RepID=UPI001F4F1558|nr:biopolymer transporter ExbD [Sphingomonas sp. LaA6.9]MCJ8158135.1 biopolymer transporter ExbD [Sphingomonas sp. LaA6.9]
MQVNHSPGSISLMNRRCKSAIALSVIVFGGAGCAHSAQETPFDVAVEAPASSCSVKVDGQAITMDELLAVARKGALRSRRARIDANEDTPYRCVGGAIFTLQMAGFKNVGFVGQGLLEE